MEPITMSCRQFMEIMCKLPSPEHMKNHPQPGSRIKVNIIDEKQGCIRTIMPYTEVGQMPELMETVAVEFQLVLLDRMIPYWQPTQPILIEPIPIDPILNFTRRYAT